MKYTHHFDEVEAYTKFTIWDEIKFWGSVALLTLVVFILIGAVFNFIDWVYIMIEEAL